MGTSVILAKMRKIIFNKVVELGKVAMIGHRCCQSGKMGHSTVLVRDEAFV